MDALTTLRDCIHKNDPVLSLRQSVFALFSDGVSKETVLASFEMFRRELQDRGDDVLEDLVLDVMDCVAGWCSPDMKLG
jgi:hypothetical protein